MLILLTKLNGDTIKLNVNRILYIKGHTYSGDKGASPINGAKIFFSTTQGDLIDVQDSLDEISRRIEATTQIT